VISWRLRPGELMRHYGLTYPQAERIIRHHTHLHWRRFSWIGGVALAMLVAYMGSAWFDIDLGSARFLLLAGASLGTGLQLWLAQRAAYPAILQEAKEVRNSKD